MSLNPVRARLAARPEGWAWSSARAHLEGRDDALVTVKPMLDRFDAAGLSELLKPSAADEAAFAALRGAKYGDGIHIPYPAHQRSPDKSSGDTQQAQDLRRVCYVSPECYFVAYTKISGVFLGRPSFPFA